MDLDTYHCKIIVNQTSEDFEFYSEGPKGKIRKIVTYQKVEDNVAPGRYFNLCFGDWDKAYDRIDDLKVSDNKDSNKILATVAKTVRSFTDKHNGCVVYVEGSTPARTRLYQMKINTNWKSINNMFSVQGQIDGEWEWFRPNRNYEAFSVSRKSA
jgi:hypothetical protein